MSNYHSEDYFNKVVKTNVKKGIVLLDSWGGQKADKFKPTKFKVLNIPKGTTGMIQPLDVYFFR